MRLLVGLCFLATSTVHAAPQKDDLPTGAIGRLGTAVNPVKDETRIGEVTALLYLGENTIFVGTNGGWNTWDLQKRQSRQTRPIGGPTFAVVRDANRIFIGSARKLHAIEPVESAMAEPARSWESASNLVRAVAVAGQRVVFSDGDQKLSVVDAKTGLITNKVQLPAHPLKAALTANGRVLAAVTRDGACRVYSVAADGTTEPLWLKRVARSEHSALQFTSDGRLLAVASAGRVIVLESSTGRALTTLERKFGEGDVRALAFAPDGRTLAIGSAGPDPIIRIWSVTSGTELASFTGHRGDLNAVAFSPDSRTVASGGSDQVVFLWKCPPVPGEDKRINVADAWDTLDALEAAEAYRAMGALLDDPKRAVEVIGVGFRGMAGEQAKIKRWIAELDHDEFRVREIARRSLLKAGLRAAAALNDPSRIKLEAEGEQRVRVILEAMEAQGMRIPESGLYGEQLRSVRGVRILETIGGKDAQAVLAEAARGPKDVHLTKEAKSALDMLPNDR
jgi:WD domain, G-beta repeat